MQVLRLELQYDPETRVFLVRDAGGTAPVLQSERRKRDIKPDSKGRYRAVGERELWDVLSALAATAAPTP